MPLSRETPASYHRLSHLGRGGGSHPKHGLDKLPKGSQAKGKGMLHEIYLAETKAGAEKAFDLFVKTYEAKYPKATECLVKDRDVLLAFCDFPAEHWVHIRTTNPIESVFSTVRRRHDKTTGNGSRAACL